MMDWELPDEFRKMGEEIGATVYQLFETAEKNFGPDSGTDFQIKNAFMEVTINGIQYQVMIVMNANKELWLPEHGCTVRVEVDDFGDHPDDFVGYRKSK